MTWPISELVEALSAREKQVLELKAELAIERSPVPRMIDRWFAMSLASKRGHETKRNRQTAKIKGTADRLRAECR